jgi:ABC-type transport system substrate-binding protein
MALILRRPYVIPDGFVFTLYRPKEDHRRGLPNLGFVDDPKMWELMQAQRLEKDVKKRKAIYDEISRRAAVQQHYVHLNSSVRVASWPSYVQNFNTNLGYDYGGRMETAWFAKS